MKIESPDFGKEDLDRFVLDLEEADRRALADRLERASARLAEVARRVERSAGDAEWSAHEVLAHIAVVSKFYGALTYKVAKGQLTELDLLGNVNLRDVAGEEMSRLSPDELVESARRDHRRTIDYLRSATAEELRRRARLTHGGEVSAADLARLTLCAHLEQHLEQLEAALA